MALLTPGGWRAWSALPTIPGNMMFLGLHSCQAGRTISSLSPPLQVLPRPWGGRDWLFFADELWVGERSERSTAA